MRKLPSCGRLRAIRGATMFLVQVRWRIEGGEDMTRRDVRRQFAWTGIVLVGGYVVFASLYLEFYRPYFPRHWDQLEYLTKVYAAYYAIIDAKTLGAVVEAFATHIIAFKGSIVGSLSLGGMLVFGPDRLVAASVNFLFLFYLTAVAISTLSTEETPYFGSILIGLVLLSNSLYIPAGGDLPDTVEMTTGKGSRQLYAIPDGLEFEPKTTAMKGGDGGEALPGPGRERRQVADVGPAQFQRPQVFEFGERCEVGSRYVIQLE